MFGMMWFNVTWKSFMQMVLLVAALFLLLILPSLLPVQSDAEKLANVERNDAVSLVATPTTIFNNNLLIAGISLVPVFGWGFIVFVMWNTGLTLASYGQPFFWVLFNPFAWVELSVYSYAVLKSVKLIHLLRQRKCNDFKVSFVKTVAYSFIFMCLILLGSALVEYWLIQGLL